MTDERVESVERRAAAQFGLFTSRDAGRIGVSPAMLHHHCSTGRWRKVAPRVWVVAAMDPPDWQPVAAALLSTGPSAVACDSGAGWLLGLDGCEGPATVAVGPGKPTRSMFETRVVQLCRTRPDIPEPARGHEIHDHGRFVAEVDLCWPDLGGYVECDGRAFHDGAVAFVRDRWREAQIAALLGWPRVPLTWPNLRHPRQTARKIAQFLATLRSRAPIPHQ